MMGTLWALQQTDLRMLAKRFLSRLEEVDAKRVLVTSVSPGDGKGRFIEETTRQLSVMGASHVFSIDAEMMFQTIPAAYGDGLVIAKGPALHEREGLFTLPDCWLHAFDAAVIIVLARRTKSVHLTRLMQWLGEFGIEQVWAVWNEREAPDMESWWLRLRKRFGRESAHALPEISAIHSERHVLPKMPPLSLPRYEPSKPQRPPRSNGKSRQDHGSTRSGVGFRPKDSTHVIETYYSFIGQNVPSQSDIEPVGFAKLERCDVDEDELR